MKREHGRALGITFLLIILGSGVMACRVESESRDPNALNVPSTQSALLSSRVASNYVFAGYDELSMAGIPWHVLETSDPALRHDVRGKIEKVTNDGERVTLSFDPTLPNLSYTESLSSCPGSDATTELGQFNATISESNGYTWACFETGVRTTQGLPVSALVAGPDLKTIQRFVDTLLSAARDRQ